MSEKLWIYNVGELFKSFQLVPRETDSYYTKLNTVFRAAIILGLILSCWKPEVGVGFVFAVAVMTIVNDALNSKIDHEAYENFEETQVDCKKGCKFTPNIHNGSFFDQDGPKINLHNFINSTCKQDINPNFPLSQLRFCDDQVPLTFDNTYKSPNNIGGPANPKTFVAPIIASPAFDLDSWKANGFVTHSAVNESRNFDGERAGYNYGLLPSKCKNCGIPPCNGCNKPHKVKFNKNTVENFEYTEKNTQNKAVTYIQQLQNSGIDIQNRQLLRLNVKNKFAEMQDKDVDQAIQTVANTKNNQYFESVRRDALLTNTIVPGVYQKTHIGEPIQSNIGISYVQDWGPVEAEDTQFGIKYTEQDPKNVTTRFISQEREVNQDVTNVYDPRLTGYGTSYRGYVDDVTGQPRYFYKDVDSITQPNFITRHNLDVFPWATTYGPDVPVPHLDEYKQLANNSFTDSTIMFRTEMMERLMRKRNAENWQRRVMPLSTMSQVS